MTGPAETGTGTGACGGSDRYQQGLNKLAEFTLPEPHGTQTHFKVAEQLHDIAPDVARFIIEFAYGDLYTRPGLTNSERALITLSSLVTLGTEAQIELHVNTALTSGVTPDQIVELMTHLIAYTGFPRVLNGLSVAKRVFEARGVSPSVSDNSSAPTPPGARVAGLGDAPRGHGHR